MTTYNETETWEYKRGMASIVHPSVVHAGCYIPFYASRSGGKSGWMWGLVQWVKHDVKDDPPRDKYVFHVDNGEGSGYIRDYDDNDMIECIPGWHWLATGGASDIDYNNLMREQGYALYNRYVDGQARAVWSRDGHA